MRWLSESLRQHPEMALFLVLALGYGLGNVRLGKFKLGPVLGVLITGIAIGQLAIPVSDVLKNIFFMLFLLAVGYRAGPQFFHSLRATGLRQIVLTLVVCAAAFVSSLVVSRRMGFDAGTSGGLFAGAMTGSAAFGAAGGGIERLNISDAERQLLQAKASVSFAVCYLVGTVLVIWLLTKLGPWLMRVELAGACRELEQEMGVPREDEEVTLTSAPFVTRAYEVPTKFAGKSIEAVESAFPGYRVFVEHLRRNGTITKPESCERLHAGDRVALWGRREALVSAADGLARHEVEDRELLDIGIIPLDIVVTRRETELTLGELAKSEAARGVFLEKLLRAGKELPFTLKTPVEPGDVLSVKGEKSHVERVAKELGYALRPRDETNMTRVSTAIFLGALVGLPALLVAGVEISLTLFVGVLIGGLVLGWLSSLYPTFGKIPEPALWLFDSLGLTGFLALVGMQAGPGFIAGLKEVGLALVASAALAVTIPHVVGILAGRYLLRMHPGIVLGACAGAGTSSPALGAVIETAGSRVPALSYGVCYALGNVILAFGGSVIVKMIGPG